MSLTLVSRSAGSYNYGEALSALWERSGSVVECLTRDHGAAGSSFTGVTALCL